ncbi:unnamed protein product [Nezara viridula]|uniref:Uncharacterized protein n=1 Tax=Nezara viridula TaxID=85310 RepID=A0A9P0H701_NEZVI|nr:unnamed protein product [Nezara viridula]
MASGHGKFISCVRPRCATGSVTFCGEEAARTRTANGSLNPLPMKRCHHEIQAEEPNRTGWKILKRSLSLLGHLPQPTDRPALGGRGVNFSKENILILE